MFLISQSKNHIVIPSSFNWWGAWLSKKKGKIGNMSKSTRGCTASHFKCWEAILSSKSDYGIVLEDDVIVLPLAPPTRITEF